MQNEQINNPIKLFKEGNAKTKLSFLFMGLGCFLNKQFIKGLIYALVEVLFIVIAIFFIAPNFARIHNLGTVATISYEDPIVGTITQSKDNSLLILLYSVASVVLIGIFLLLYLSSIKSAHLSQLRVEDGKAPYGFLEDIAQALDKKFHATLLALPLGGILVFTVVPLVFMILIAFTNYNIDHLPPGELFTWDLSTFGGLFSFGSEYSRTFLGLLAWTIIWAIFATFTNYIFGIIVALMINRKGIKGKSIFRTMFVVTIAVPQFVSIMLVGKLLANEGVLNNVLMTWGWIAEPIKFFTGSRMTARVTVIVVNMWVGMPYTLLIATGILSNIPADLYESAKIDGASAVKMFVAITMPYILFVTSPYLITQFVGNINNFNVIYLLTGGGPNVTEYYNAGATDLLITWLYKLSMDRAKNYSLASTIGLMMFILCGSLSLLAYNFTGAVKKEGDFQ